MCFSDAFRTQLQINLNNLKLDNPEAEADTFWELVKTMVRGLSIGYKKFKAQVRKEVIEEYERQIVFLYDQKHNEKCLLTQARLIEDINKVTWELDDLFYSNERRGMLII